MELQQLFISAQSVKAMGTFAQDFFKEAKKIDKSGARVYQTYPMDDDASKWHFVFTTTSKDVHLVFGLLGLDGQHALAHMLAEEFRLRKCSQLLLGFDQKRDFALVTQTVEHEHVANWKTFTFTFSPAH